MLIHHDPHLSRGRVLMPVPRREWMPPSRTQQKTFCGDEDRTRFRLRARAHDGHEVWTGWFDDRDDADAFLFELFSGSLRYERELWRLPFPEWHPGLGEDLSYEFSAVTFLTGTGASQTYNVPSDWNNSRNIIRCIGGGGSGGARRGDSLSILNSAGGGGGGYGGYTNLTLTPGGTTTYGIVAGGSAVSRNTNGQTNGNAGGATYFGAATYAGALVGGNGGAGGTAGNTTLSAASGGTGKGTASFTGGSGGAVTSATNGRRATGGGGAAGPNGNGNNGSSQSTSSGGSNGGSGNAGFGGSSGTGGSSSGGTGGNGTEFQISPAYGTGGGGGGREALVDVTGGSGGNYGAGGGGATCQGAFTSSTSGAGINGLIVVEYSTPSLIFNPQPFLHILTR